MPLLLSDRATITSPLPLTTFAEARMLGIRLPPSVWLRVRRGIYVDRAAYAKLPPWKRYEVRVHAFARQHPDAVLCLESAAVPHGLPLFGEAREIHVFDPDRASSRRFGDVFVHKSVDPRTVVHVGGILVTDILDTVVDLSRVLPPAQALAMADSATSAAQGGRLSVDELRSRSEEQLSQRGRGRLRWTWSHADGRAESPAESVSRAVIAWTGFETPVLQEEFRYEGFVDRTDFHFPSCGAIGEADGWWKYRLENPADAARLLADEKRREDRLRRNGHPFARWDLADVWKVEPLERALSHARIPRTASRQTAMLQTLKQRPREKPRASRSDA